MNRPRVLFIALAAAVAVLLAGGLAGSVYFWWRQWDRWAMRQMDRTAELERERAALLRRVEVLEARNADTTRAQAGSESKDDTSDSPVSHNSLTQAPDARPPSRSIAPEQLAEEIMEGARAEARSPRAGTQPTEEPGTKQDTVESPRTEGPPTASALPAGTPDPPADGPADPPLRPRLSRLSPPRPRLAFPRAVPRGRVYLGVGETQSLRSVSRDGRILILDDGSVWEVDSLDRFDTSLWLSLDDILVLESPDSPAEYDLIHKDNGERARARLLRED